ncbi:hypothetical protein NHX12_019337, partial [Muraenolepis orangiensis]
DPGALGGTSALHIPAFPSGGCLIDYVPQVCQLLTNKPTLTFQSVYHFTSSGQLYSQVQKSYPYSPRWDGNEMAKRAKTKTPTVIAFGTRLTLRSPPNQGNESRPETFSEGRCAESPPPKLPGRMAALAPRDRKRAQW